MASGRAAALLGLAFALSGCLQAAAPREPTATTASPAPTAVAQRDPAAHVASPFPAAPTTSAVAPRASESPPPCSPSTPASAFSETTFTKFHAGPVLSAAVGTPPRAALWSGSSVTLFEGATARELPAPHLPPGAAVEVFFGRDNQPRLMGFAPGAAGQEVPVYLRFRNGVFRPEPSELGPLASPRGALYGVLGFDDPEVVCRPRERCLVKRTTGWGRVAAHDAPVRIVLRSGSVFALHAKHVERLGGDGWAPLEPVHQFERPLDAWLSPNGELWVADRSAAGLWRLRGAAWEVVASPIREPRAVFGRSERGVFVVGSNGAAEFDGARFRCVRGVDGPLHIALAVGSEVWLAGESGAFRSVAP